MPGAPTWVDVWTLCPSPGLGERECCRATLASQPGGCLWRSTSVPTEPRQAAPLAPALHPLLPLLPCGCATSPSRGRVGFPSTCCRASPQDLL